MMTFVAVFPDSVYDARTEDLAVLTDYYEPRFTEEDKKARADRRAKARAEHVPRRALTPAQLRLRAKLYEQERMEELMDERYEAEQARQSALVARNLALGMVFHSRLGELSSMSVLETDIMATILAYV